MDPFSAASSAFSVVSLAIQFADGINNLCKLLHSITEAPKEIESIINELRFFSQLLNEIQKNEETLGPHLAIKQALERCEAPLEDLNRIADSLVPGFAATSNAKRKWAAITAAKLRDAKIDFILARNLASDRTHRHYYESYQESLVPVAKGIADIRERLSFHGETVTLHGEAESEIVRDLSSEIQKALSSWPLDQFRSVLEAELRKEIQTTIVSVLDQHKQQRAPLSSVIEELNPDSGALLGRYRNRRAVSTCSTTTPTMLGQVHYKTTSYIISTQSAMAVEHESTKPAAKLEVETVFSFVPSWWMTKLLTTRAIKVDIFKLSTQGWQTNIHSFNVLPEDSPIFEFCRTGNLDAVRYLIRSGKASVNDMTEYGWTPLHFAASRSHADICALLLQEGAHQRMRDYTGFNRTAFGCVCLPGYMLEDGSLRFINVPAAQHERAIREFIKAGEDFADLVSDGSLENLISFEGAYRDLANSPSMWLLNNIVPVTNPTILDSECWVTCLKSIIALKPGHSLLPEILRHCDTSMARTGIMDWIRQLDGARSLTDSMFRDFQLLVQMSGGLCFVHQEYYRSSEETCPIFLAMRYSYYFSIFRTALEKTGIDISELVRTQIELHPNGWTEERLLSLFLDQTRLEPRIYSFGGKCKLCKRHLQHPDTTEPSWNRKVERIRIGVDCNAPLSEEEAREQKELDDAITDYENGICRWCHEENRREKRIWSPLG